MARFNAGRALPARGPSKPVFSAAPQPSAAAAPTPSQPQAPRFDAGYENQVGLANRQYDTTIAGLDYQQGQVRRQYGFDDPSDPLNAAAMLQRAYQQNQRRTLNSSQNVYSSAHLRNSESNRFQYVKSEDELRKSYMEALHALEQQRAQAGIDRDLTISNAQLDAIARAPRADDPGEPSAPAAPKLPAGAKWGPGWAFTSKGRAVKVKPKKKNKKRRR